MGALWGWPQWLILGLSVFNVVVAISYHGEPRSAWSGPTMFVSTCITIWILWMGGFFP